MSFAKVLLPQWEGIEELKRLDWESTEAPKLLT